MDPAMIQEQATEEEQEFLVAKMPAETKERLREIARLNGLSMSAQVRYWIEQAWRELQQAAPVAA